MAEGQNTPQYLPINEFMGKIQEGDFDLSQLRTVLDQLQGTTFGQNLAQRLDVVTSNAGAHAVLRGELHSAIGREQEFYHDNLPIRQEVARRIEQDTGYAFNPMTYTPEMKDEIWRALGEFTGVFTDQASEEAINLKLPDRYPPSIYRVAWIGEDEVVIRQDDLYSIDRDLEPGHILNANEHTYTVYKAGQFKGRLCFTELSDYDLEKHKNTIFVRASDQPLSQTYFTDRISGGTRNEFVYVNSQSSYIQPTKPSQN